MTNAFSSMGYPHWLIVAGAVRCSDLSGSHFAKERTLRPSLKKWRMGMSKGGPTWPNSLRHRLPIGRRSLRSRRGRDGLTKTAAPKKNRGTICRRFLTRNRNDRSGSSGDYKCPHSVAVDAGRWGDDARISDLEPKFALGLRHKAAGESLDGRFQTYCASRARTLMTERAVHLPPRPEGSPRSLSAFAVAFALSPAYSAKISLSC